MLLAALAVGMPETVTAQKRVQYTSMSASGLSPEAAMLLMELRSDKPDLKHYSTVVSDGRECLSAFVVPAVESVEWRKAVEPYGVKVVAEGRQFSVLIPVDRFEALAVSGLCSYIDLGHKNVLHNNRVRGAFAADHIHRGEGLAQGYDGTGVVVGIIDVGFEFGHPSFYDSTGTTLRVKRVWSQIDQSGTPPEGFSYGSEYATPEDILAAGSDHYPHTHGTHVAGTAAGCGAPGAEGSRYCGVAPAADLVLVGSTLQDPDIYNAILYIHRYARSVGKPCVINMSLGTQLGSHDGQTGIDANIESYLGGPTHTDSIVLVSSASNDGGMRVHRFKHFSAVDSVITVEPHTLSQTDVYEGIVIWGGVGDTFDVELKVLNLATNEIDCVSPLMRCGTVADSVYNFTLPVPNDRAPYNFFVVTTAENPQNHKPNVEIVFSLDSLDVNPRTHALLLSVYSQSADIHMWTNGAYFAAGIDYPGMAYGDDAYTIGGIGGNGTAAISVGSYNTRQAWTRRDGTVAVSAGDEEGDISNFTSNGPTADGRTKPDVATPGAVIVSSVSRLWPDYLTTENLYDSVVWNGQTEYYATMSGTSMASPAAAGVVALWLQENPALNVDSVRAIMHATAIKDYYTGEIGTYGDNTWGWGKLNALGALPVTGQFHNVTLWSENLYMGVVEGMGRHLQGTHTVSAHPAPGYVFTQWNDGVTDNPRQLNLVSDTTLTAFFERENDCDTIEVFPAPMELNESGNCWYNIDGDGDGGKWSFIMTSLVSTSVSTRSSDNWLITPPIKAVAGLGLQFTAKDLLGNVRFSIKAAEESTDTADFATVLYSEEFSVNDDMDTVVNLSAYAGRTVRLAFRTQVATGQMVFMIQNLEFVLGQPEVGIADVDADAVGYVLDGRTLTLFNPQGLQVTVYDVVGRQVATLHSTSSALTLPAAGVYTIRYGSNSARIVVAR